MKLSTTLLGYAKGLLKIAGYVSLAIVGTPGVINLDGTLNKGVALVAIAAAVADIINGHKTPNAIVDDGPDVAKEQE